MTHGEVELLRDSMLTVIANLSTHDIRNLSIIEDCTYCPECMKEVCPTKNISYYDDSELSCEHAWVRAAQKMVNEGKIVPMIPLINLSARKDKKNGFDD